MANVETFYDKQGNSVTGIELMKGKSGSQITALKLFNGIPVETGCMKKVYLSYNGYMDIVKAQRGTGDYKDRALDKLGIDEDQVKEIEPVCFEGFRFDYDKLPPYAALVDNHYVASMYEITWIFFGNDQVYVYNHAFDTTDQTMSDRTLEYFYKDITAFVTSSDTVSKKIWKNGESQMINVTSELFSIKVPGDTFACALSNADNYAKAIAAMKQKLREMKTK
jgi:hypothetical protein